LNQISGNGCLAPENAPGNSQQAETLKSPEKTLFLLVSKTRQGYTDHSSDVNLKIPAPRQRRFHRLCLTDSVWQKLMISRGFQRKYYKGN
jgi:hypothetical protein